MLTIRVIPCLDVRDGRVVKGVRFQNLRDAGDPAELAARYEAQGADEIVLLDVSATPEGRAASIDTVRRTRDALRIPLTVGGGVRTEADAARLLDAGADKVGVNSAAVAEPPLLTRLAATFGAQCVVLAVDARRVADPRDEPRWTVLTHSGRTDAALDALAWCAAAQRLGAGEVLLTSWDRDGTHAGYDLDLLRAARARLHVPLIASGGAGAPADLLAAARAGADAVLAASIFHDARHSVADVKRTLAAAGVEIRA